MGKKIFKHRENQVILLDDDNNTVSFDTRRELRRRSEEMSFGTCDLIVGLT